MKRTKTFDDILAHQRAANKRLNLVASENSLGSSARIAFLTDVVNRYYFPLNEFRHWAFPGNEHLESIYTRCSELLKKLTGAAYINIRPISGISAMTIALSALAKPGETIATLAPENGGHSITHHLARRLGIKTIYIPYDQERFEIKTDMLTSLVLQHNVSLLYLDQAHILFPFNLTEIKTVVPNTVKIYYDGSHVLGLIFGGQFQNPLNEGATFFGGNTHKTIPGPHKAFIATNSKPDMPGIDGYSKLFVSHDHAADVAALAIVLEEMEGTWETYAQQIVKNAQYFGKVLTEKGFLIAAKRIGFTKSHQIWIDTQPHMEAFEAVMALARCNIITNTINAPSIPGRLAIRIGVQEVTYLGATEKTMDALAVIFKKIIIDKTHSEDTIRKEVAEIKQQLMPPIRREEAMGLIESLFAETS